MNVKDNSVVLFQGDSITDAGRSRENDAELGQGYAMMAASWYAAMYPDRKITFLNRGNSGDRVKDLLARWENDCLKLKPDVVSILVGINDTWRRYDSNDPTPTTVFEQQYRELLSRTQNIQPSIIILEPFVLHVPDDRKKWREDLDPKIEVVRRLAREYRAVYVPMDSVFAAASSKRPPDFWAQDGVHPTHAGHALIARHWLEVFGSI